MMRDLIELITSQPDTSTAWVAVFALVVASASLLATIITLFVQRDHNRKSVAPVAQFSMGDYENLIEVALDNKGLGPLRIDDLAVYGAKLKSDRLVSLMPDLPDSIFWSTYTGDVSSRWLSAGERISILKLAGSVSDPKFCAYRDRVRKELGKLSIRISYSDVYKKEQNAHERRLDWFLRSFQDAA